MSTTILCVKASSKFHLTPSTTNNLNFLFITWFDTFYLKHISLNHIFDPYVMSYFLSQGNSFLGKCSMKIVRNRLQRLQGKSFHEWYLKISRKNFTIIYIWGIAENEVSLFSLYINKVIIYAFTLQFHKSFNASKHTLGLYITFECL